MSSNYGDKGDKQDKSSQDQSQPSEPRDVDREEDEGSVSAQGNEEESSFEAGEAGHPRLLSVVPVDIDQLLADFDAEE